ncbi:hypothetical protein ACFPMF_07060 [Larkinella bovis]|uniref:Outer membrane protein beta-barrel domain-containing protein n=1 Tax=Larkinella bovis TaxID=683041 RepID=A0ABW0ICJ6_9BACT
MKRFWAILGFWVMGVSAALAQKIDYKNAIRVGVDYLSLDAPDSGGNRYLVRYARHLGNDRIVLEASLGYLKVSNSQLLPSQFVFEGRPRKRITTDVMASFDFVRNPQHALRLGIGPSVWYREDDVVRSARYEGTTVTIENRKIDEVNIGGNVAVEYEIVVFDRINLGVRAGLTNFKTAGISSMVGLNGGFTF